MKSQDDIYYQAYLSRDHRFDGKFFTGVKTTGIYCRPICPAKPMRKNVEFFNDALGAEKAGYRPCLRCRPECAPMSPAWLGQSATLQRALKLITNNVLNECDEDVFAEHLGLSARHLRRLFKKELGKTPKQIHDMNRLNFTRQLVVETKLPMTDIAFSAGFSSIRRFNEAFKNRFYRPPSDLRKMTVTPDEGAFHFTLAYRPPFDWHSLLSFYKSHAISGIETVDDQNYSRVFKLDGVVGGLSLAHDPEKHELHLKIATSQAKSIHVIVQNIRQMFDLDSDPMMIQEALASCKTMSKLTEKYPGLRLPRGWDALETIVCSILGQLVTVEQGRRLVWQLVENYGEEVKNPLSGEKAFLFPSPDTLAKSSLTKVGTTEVRKNAIREFAKLVLSKKIRLDSAQDPLLFRETLLQIKGLGPWTADYVSLRALGDTDSFPKTDLILKRVLEKHSKIQIDQFKPWRGYAAIYLWKEFAQSFSKKKVKTL